MQDCKPLKTPIPLCAKLSTEQCPKTEEVVEEMSCVPYANVLGSLMYAMVCTRPDIAHAEGFLSRYMSKPSKEHWNAIKRVFRYLRGTYDFSICYQGKRKLKSLDIEGFVDVDWVGDLDSTCLEELLVR